MKTAVILDFMLTPRQVEAALKTFRSSRSGFPPIAKGVTIGHNAHFQVAGPATRRRGLGVQAQYRVAVKSKSRLRQTEITAHTNLLRLRPLMAADCLATSATSSLMVTISS